MNKYKYKDLVYAEKVYNEGFLTKYRDTEMKLVALYMRDVLHITKKRDRKEALHEFCEKHLSDYHKMKYYKAINRALDYSSNKKNFLITIESIPVIRDEIDYLNSQELTNDEKKLLFTLLVTYKLRKTYFEIKNPDEVYENVYFKGGISQYNDLKKISNLNTKFDINKDVVSELATKGYVKIYSRGCIRLDFLEQIEYVTGEIAFEITDYNNIGYWFEWYNGNNRISKCNRCGNVFYRKVNNQIYCVDCQGYQKEGIKKIKCCDCGTEFDAESLSRAVRCSDCQKKHRSEYIAQKMKENYYKSK